MMIVTDETVKQQWYDYLTNEYELQAIVLAHYLAEGDNRPDYDEAQSDFDSEHYLVYTNEEADEAVREEIEQLVWAFNPSFLSAHTRVSEEAIKKIQEMCLMPEVAVHLAVAVVVITMIIIMQHLLIFLQQNQKLF